MKSVLTLVLTVLFLASCAREESSTITLGNKGGNGTDCVYNGVTYPLGPMPAQDACNTWECTANGVVSTQNFCN